MTNTQCAVAELGIASLCFVMGYWNIGYVIIGVVPLLIGVAELFFLED